MSLLKESIEKYLVSQEWRYEFREEERYFSMYMNLKAVDRCRVIIDLKGEGETGFVVYSIFPIKTPEAKRPAVAEFITRANYCLLNGNFEMDYDDGEVRYKVMTRCGNIEYDPDSMEVIVDCGFSMLNRYGEDLLSVIYGNVDPAEAVKHAERDRGAPSGAPSGAAEDAGGGDDSGD